MNACTIIARNYLAQARVLAESFREHHPDCTFSVLVIDALDAPLSGAREPFEALRPEDIGFDEREFHRMAMIYDVTELATAVKPTLLRHLLGRESEVVYFDPDIQIFAPLGEVFELAREHGIVLTPHTTEPMPRDEAVPNELTLLLAGIFNLGFIGVGRSAEPFLDWWAERLARDCFLAPEEGHAFVDQRWVDFAPGLFDNYILRDPGYNVAHWNVPTRRVVRAGDGYEVNGRPLRFYHFSGFDPRKPWLLSKHQGKAPRILLSEQGELAQICKNYARRLLDAGYDDCNPVTYGFDSLPGGTPIDARMRKLYRQAVAAAEEGSGLEPPDPFDELQPERFFNWLLEPFDRRGEAVTVSRYLHAVYSEHEELHDRFHDLRWLHADEFLDWVRSKGRFEDDIPFELVPPPPGDARDVKAPALPRAELGLNVAGYFRAELGVGEAARHLLAALKHAGIPHSTLTYTETSSRQEHPFEAERSTAGHYDTNLICVNADRLPDFAYDVGPSFFAGRYSIGVWWWEIGEFPDSLHDSFDTLDEVWVGSDFVAQAISAHTEKPVLALPLGVEVKAPPVRLRSQLGLPEGFLFLFAFDFFSVVERKNPLALIEAFTREFAPGEGPVLVIKSINGDQNLVALEQLRAAAAARSDIRIVDTYLAPEDKNALMAGCDCYVSLHRSEGFGLTLIEAMAYARPVIATGYSGNLDFMNEGNSYLVPYTLGAVPSGCDPYPEGSEWAEPDVDAAAALMRHVFEHPDEASEKGRVAQQEIRANHSPERTGAFIAHRLDEIRNSRPEVPWGENVEEQESEPRGKALEQAAAFLARGPSIPWSAPSRLGRLGQLARRILLRLLRPYTARQREFESAVVEAMHELERAAEREATKTEKRELALHDLLLRQLERLERLERRLASSDAALGPQLAQIVARLARFEDALDARATRSRREPEESPLAR